MTAIEKGKRARNVDIKKHYEIMTQLLLQLSCCASSKKSDPDLQRPLKSFSFDFSTGANKSDRRWHQHFSLTFPIPKQSRLSRAASCAANAPRPKRPPGAPAPKRAQRDARRRAWARGLGGRRRCVALAFATALAPASAQILPKCERCQKSGRWDSRLRPQRR